MQSKIITSDRRITVERPKYRLETDKSTTEFYFCRQRSELLTPGWLPSTESGGRTALTPNKDRDSTRSESTQLILLLLLLLTVTKSLHNGNTGDRSVIDWLHSSQRRWSA